MLPLAKSKVAHVLDASSGIPTDVIFQVHNVVGESQEFQAHKYYLALVSEAFKARFFGSLRETKDILEVKGTTPQAFEAMINFIYHKDCQWESKSVEELFEIANILIHIYI